MSGPSVGPLSDQSLAPKGGARETADDAENRPAAQQADPKTNRGATASEADPQSALPAKPDLSFEQDGEDLSPFSGSETEPRALDFQQELPGSGMSSPTNSSDAKALDGAETAHDTAVEDTSRSARSESHIDPSHSEMERAYAQAIMALVTAPRGPDDTFEAFLEQRLSVLFPDTRNLRKALRQVAVRLSYADGTYSPALRHRALATVEALLASAKRDRARTGGEADIIDPVKPVSTEPGRSYLSQRGGLVLFHPFLPLLFERLELLDSKRRLPKQHVPIARRALQLIGDPQAVEDQPTDPVEKLLLGLPQNWAAPTGKVAEPPDLALINSLLASVIERWGALGQTSPDGLREAFIRRNATLRAQEASWVLRVERGPFDMLLDQLPWSFGTVALPWMPEPCTVNWREQDG
ncbi:contractile injection system tape measure protein [uncultured Roseobacter sp.]|uniref:contractile injection system tape measure protein n=1 Tax=uncultured Roseobacter sp. TaxID=114847 RepID=UPI002615F3EE|nr:contractile injection system tape measure protein [uncultured Roseobacter sp.]